LRFCKPNKDIARVYPYN